ncbi:hypothetical protein HBI56_144540 [Parastagonospora nodorum]|uniref:Uncharacterized protein n=1 Tax=Phaeosphaeria nodorum (strain SN15 / ATCC MYA-4574 / FGSC 10173) TaxID=321614 RepID=A0A7U2I5P2_PHANO|nr:hypothetical protein HBH56_032480 [Parastagonospora nodorum]QRD00318.1 hypothetical protein JI435_414990 [Parastagonospora nodorum SN15]KAH3933821.1 hypothetical protein HBH54_066960 [Parastagonospora nodorum]KAH3979652.1 hypothetical protein HBH51_054110 [Parastagonospora nodorum]KAH4047370.1 hypothetical protein HBH49_173260 [Parastagonospora nodorum]
MLFVTDPPSPEPQILLEMTQACNGPPAMVGSVINTPGTTNPHDAPSSVELKERADDCFSKGQSFKLDDDRDWVKSGNTAEEVVFGNRLEGTGSMLYWAKLTPNPRS